MTQKTKAVTARIRLTIKPSPCFDVPHWVERNEREVGKKGR
jgi:hypothetical protein